MLTEKDQWRIAISLLVGGATAGWTATLTKYRWLTLIIAVGTALGVWVYDYRTEAGNE